MPRISLDEARAMARVDRVKLDATGEADIARQIAEDPDTAPDQGDLPSAAFTPRRAWPDPAALRRRLGLTQQQFADAYGLNVWVVRDWEQGRAQPDGTARSYLRIIDRDPDAVRRLYAESRPAA